MLRFLTVLSTSTPAARLLGPVLLFTAVDILFMGFAMAYGFAEHGLEGALLVLAAQYLFSTAGFLGAFRWMSRGAPAYSVLRCGIGGMLAGTAAAAVMGEPMAGLAMLAAAGAGRGMAWAGRQWMELHHTRGEARETYLSLLQTASTMFKLTVPLAAAGVMLLSGDNFQLLFGLIAVAGLWALHASRAPAPLETPAPATAKPLRALASREYWRTAPFYVLEGAGASLRQALFVSGTMTVVGSAASYGAVDAVASLAAAAFLAWLARRPSAGPSLARLRYSLALVALSWLLLLGALKLPVLFVGFVAAFAFGNPLLITVKASLVLKGLNSAGGEPQDNATARELLLVGSRLLALTLCAALASAWVDPLWGLCAVVAAVIVRPPLEYWFAQELTRRRAPV